MCKKCHKTQFLIFLKFVLMGLVNSARDPHKNTGCNLQNHFNTIQTYTKWASLDMAGKGCGSCQCYKIQTNYIQADIT